MVDSHALVGSCAQVGKRVHISAAAQIGGVLEPINASPVIIEDDVLIGGNCGVYEGTQVGARAVLGAGVILTRSTPLFDTVKGEIYRATATEPLRVPEGAVVVPGRARRHQGQGCGLGIVTVHAGDHQVSRRADRPGSGVGRFVAMNRACRSSGKKEVSSRAKSRDLVFLDQRESCRKAGPSTARPPNQQDRGLEKLGGRSAQDDGGDRRWSS